MVETAEVVVHNWGGGHGGPERCGSSLLGEGGGWEGMG